MIRGSRGGAFFLKDREIDRRLSERDTKNETDSDGNEQQKRICMFFAAWHAVSS